jgi:hypothetical protein
MRAIKLARLALATMPLVSPTLAVAGESKPFKDLPGVSPPAPIVKPVPEHIEPRPQTDGYERMGKWEMKISGYTRIDIGAGKPSPEKR